MLKVGLTGGIASGKSTVSEAFARLGAKVLDADKVAREVVLPGQPAWLKLQQAFGPEYFLPDGEVNRSKLRRLVFADPEERDKLNAIVHPEVMTAINRRFEQLTTSAQDAVVVVDVPLLLEVGVAHRFDRVIVVYVTENVQIERLMQRDGITKEEATEALRAQMPLSQKVEAADFVIDNSGTRDETQAQVEKVWQELLVLARKKEAE
ncbi:MAG: dephospho-CoA kinase [Deltaproteobacteria bacterium]|nr:dephospho-CoA kinase [Deltaproteobacteria bacterium]